MSARAFWAATLRAVAAAYSFLPCASCASSSAIFSFVPVSRRSSRTLASALAAAAARAFLVSVTLMTTMLTTDVDALTVDEGVSTVVSLRSRLVEMSMPIRPAASLRTTWEASNCTAALALELRPAMGLPLASVVCPM